MKTDNIKTHVENTVVPIWFLLLGSASVTLYFNTKILDPFNTPKTIIAILMAGWALGYLAKSYRNKNPFQKSLGGFVFLFALMFIIFMLLNLIYSDVFVVSFIGETQRRNGFLAYFALVVIFLFSAQFMTSTHTIKLIKTSIAVCALMSIYGVIQILGKDFVAWENPYNAMLSTLGNPNFASAMLAIFSLLGFFSFFIGKLSIPYKILIFLNLGLSFFAIIKSQSRQGLIVILVGAIFYITLFVFLNHKKLRWLIVPLAFILMTQVILGMLNKGFLSSMLYKESISIRGYYWRAGFKMFQEMPFLGVGLDRYGAFFKQFRETEYSRRYGFEITSTNAHNTIIQFLATGGFLLGITYLLLLFAILVMGIKLMVITSGDDRAIAGSVLTAWIGFQSQSFISIDNIGISIWGWLLAGAIVCQYNDKNSTLRRNTLVDKKLKTLRNGHLSTLQPMVSFVVTMPLIVISALMIQADSKTYEVRAIVGAGIQEIDKTRILQISNEIFNNPLADPFYKYQAALTLVDYGYLQQGLNQIRKLSKEDERNLYYLEWLAQYEQKTGNIAGEINLREKISFFDPWNDNNTLRLSKLYSESGNRIKADLVLSQLTREQ